ncbi:hypothetical protein ANN_18857 [Periplaneta americana]|uniref:Uncharacterized protein n=1 Tax=Periplaneta americana TaxID=6978 RepID=A0ABQ8SPX4_PERAM|nr:hypothetical protein ANN_18857 [Periplaneta americana]
MSPGSSTESYPAIKINGTFCVWVRLLYASDAPHLWLIVLKPIIITINIVIARRRSHDVIRTHSCKTCTSCVLSFHVDYSSFIIRIRYLVVTMEYTAFVVFPALVSHFMIEERQNESHNIEQQDFCSDLKQCVPYSLMCAESENASLFFVSHSVRFLRYTMISLFDKRSPKKHLYHRIPVVEGVANGVSGSRANPKNVITRDRNRNTSVYIFVRPPTSRGFLPMKNDVVYTNSSAVKARDSPEFSKAMIYNLVKKFSTTGSVLNKKRTCVKRVLTEEMLDEIGHRLERSPTTSSRRIGQQERKRKKTCWVAKMFRLLSVLRFLAVLLASRHWFVFDVTINLLPIFHVQILCLVNKERRENYSKHRKIVFEFFVALHYRKNELHDLRFIVIEKQQCEFSSVTYALLPVFLAVYIVYTPYIILIKQNSFITTFVVTLRYSFLPPGHHTTMDLKQKRQKLCP